MIAARKLHTASTDRTATWFFAVLAAALHAALLLAWKGTPVDSPASEIEGDGVEVALVESAPAAAVAAPPEPAPTPAPAPTPVPAPQEPEPTPTPPPVKEPEMARPEPPKPTPPPRTAKRTPAPRSAAPAGAASGTGSPTGATGGSAGIGSGKRASYVLRPIARYPAESRAAGEHGTVILRLIVDGSGRPTSVSIAKSSGHPRLDRAAVEAGWRCRVRDAAPGQRLDAPVRFNLNDR